METSSASVRRVQQALDTLGLGHHIVELPQSTRTAAEAAAAVGCQVGQICKSLVFRTGETLRPLLIIASGANRVNESALGQRLGEPIVKADADFARQATGFAIGGVAPVALAQPMDIYVDQDLLQHDSIWAAAGSPHAVFRLTPQELVAMTNGRVLPIG